MQKKYVMLTTIVALITIGCATNQNIDKNVRKIPVKPILRVGITPDSPPIIFQVEKRTVGIEADFAQGIANKLDRRVQFIPLKFNKLITELVAGNIDVIMSGMTVTKARRLRVDFTKPYLTNGLMALMRTDDAQVYTSPEKIFKTSMIIGVQKGSTGDTFVRRMCPYSTVATFFSTENAVRKLKRKQIDLYIDDGTTIAWLVSENEAFLSGLFTPLTKDPLAWGVRRGNQQLLDSLNKILDEWERDGKLDKILKKWLPYLRTMRSNL